MADGSSRALAGGEARIARLAARGRRNDEIARELGLSPKTVEWNLTRIYRKLGVRSRTELALRLRSGEIPWAEQEPELAEWRVVVPRRVWHLSETSDQTRCSQRPTRREV